MISSVVRLFGNFALVSDDVLKRECGSGESDRGGRGNLRERESNGKSKSESTRAWREK